MKYSFFNWLPFLLCVVLSSCQNNTNEKNTQADTAKNQTEPYNLKVDSSIVLEVGQEKLTVYELQKNFRLFKQTEQESNRPPAEADIRSWMKGFVDRAYILADAHAKGYYNRKDVQSTVESTASLMLSQPHGLLEQRLTAKLKPEDVLKEMEQSNNQEDRIAVTARLKQKIVNGYFEKIRKLTSLRIDRYSIAFLGRIVRKQKDTHEIKMDDIRSVSGNRLATYTAPDGNKTMISVADFTNYYNSLPIKRLLKDTAAVAMYLQGMAANAYIKQDAEKMGIMNDAEFKFNKKNFTDNVVYQKYREEQLTGPAPVSEDEILKVYTEVRNKMLRPTGIVYSIFTFSNLQNAKEARWLLQRNPNDASHVLNALSSKQHIKFNENSAQLADTLKQSLFGLQPGKSSLPIELNDYYTILLMESATGSVPFKVNEIRPQLINVAIEKRRTDNQRALIGKLNEKYKKTGSLDPKLLLDL